MTKLVYRGRRWKALRAACLQRDRHRCQIGLPGCKGRANSADHIVEVEDGGATALWNLQAACMSCNVAKRNIRKGREAAGLSRGTVRSW